MSAMGTKIDEFDVPVCNSFQAKIQNDQLCYEVDLDKFSKLNNIDNELKLGFAFILDCNEDRQVSIENTTTRKETKIGLTSRKVDSGQPSIYIDTIGNI